MMVRMKDSYAALLGWRRGLIRNSDAGELLELFLVAAVCAVLGIRAFLAAAGYPQIGGSGLHIAHMLWGGGFMMIALILLFSFLSRSLDRVAAVLGGVGFGAFIDELGKFITSDNNYFFAPTIGLIYVIFISIFWYCERCAAPGYFSPATLWPTPSTRFKGQSPRHSIPRRKPTFWPCSIRLIRAIPYYPTYGPLLRKRNPAATTRPTFTFDLKIGRWRPIGV